MDEADALTEKKWNVEQGAADIEDNDFNEDIEAGSSFGDLDLWSYNIDDELPVGDLWSSSTAYSPPKRTWNQPTTFSTPEALPPLTSRVTRPPPVVPVKSTKTESWSRSNRGNKSGLRRIGWAGRV